MGKSKELISFFEDMLSRQEYLIPMVAASFQYPIHYYGMTSAALLEDLFVDASINFRNSYRREIEITRPERAVAGEEANSKGVKGWDYQFQGEHFSHKVGKGINAIALLWDATVILPENKKWNYESTMVYVLSNYKKSSGKLLSDNKTLISVNPISNVRNKIINEGQTIFIVERLASRKWFVHEVIKTEQSEEISDFLPLESIWGKMIGYWSDKSANSFEIFISSKADNESYTQLLKKEVIIEFEAEPGVYIFDKEKLKNIEVTKNNRAVLLPATTVARLVTESSEEGLFVFMSTWYAAYAENRPADLYLAQKQEFDSLNSASRRR